MLTGAPFLYIVLDTLRSEVQNVTSILYLRPPVCYVVRHLETVRPLLPHHPEVDM